MLRSRLSALMYIHETFTNLVLQHFDSLFVWLVADVWCWFVLRVKYCWLIAGGWFVLREKYCWLVADKPSEQGARVNGFCPKQKKLTKYLSEIDLSTTENCEFTRLVFAINILLCGTYDFVACFGPDT
jgi:hypothetical protein